ncbi:hypothetical protein LTR53_006867 [Teratosphaeriaceae sp. CCFEE 6253]|nr:hypothetical protein LTR53_006867 [Teratosphaeriaceae sp. CCFEE 6253]
MSGRLSGLFSGVILAGAVGVFTTYATFQPELVKQKEDREGTFQADHHSAEKSQKKYDTAISDAIWSDLREAERQVVGPTNGKKGALWGIREVIWGKGPQENPVMPNKTMTTSAVPGTMHDQPTGQTLGVAGLKSGND